MSQYVESIVQTSKLLSGSADHRTHARAGEELGGVQSLARQLRGEFGFISVDRDKEDNQQLLTFLGAVDRGMCAVCNK